MSLKYGPEIVGLKWIFVIVFCIQFFMGSTTPSNDPLCKTYPTLSPAEQVALHQLYNSKCSEIGETDQSIVDKRKPNFIRFGRSMGLASMHSAADPNFLRFGRSAPESLDIDEYTSPSEKRASSNANFLRFGKSTKNMILLLLGKSSDPNFLRFGKRSANLLDNESLEPNFLRFGRKLPNNNFLRFGRSPNQAEKFDREYRKPNFLRFG